VIVLNRFPLFYVLLAHGKKRTQPRAKALPWVWCFFDFVEKPPHPTPIGLAAKPPASKPSRFCVTPGHCCCAARNGQSPGKKTKTKAFFGGLQPPIPRFAKR
jgi:hypothetical protein